MAVLALLGAAGRAAPAPSDAPANDSVVALPPYFVFESGGGRPWTYSSLPGIEVLSKCSDRATGDFERAFYLRHVILGEMLPPALRQRTTAPISVILFNQDMEKAMAKEMVAMMEGGANPPPAYVHRIPQLRLWDEDSNSANFILEDDRSDDYENVVLAPEYIEFLLLSRAPRLPAWFMVGILKLYKDATFTDDSIRLGPMTWISPDITRGILDDPKHPPELAPIGRMLADPPLPIGKDPASVERMLRWQAQCALFVRWALDGRDHPLRAGMWRFADRSSQGAGTEDAFRECLGMGFADAGARLEAYLLPALRNPLVLKASPAPRATPPEPRPATASETGRILGDWECKEISFVRARFPQFEKKYVEQAERTIGDAYTQDNSDPRLQAVVGLFECLAGRDDRARPYLEVAVQNKVALPRAYVELARIRLAEAKAKPGGPEGRLDAIQVGSVLAPLAAARALQPPQFETYTLVAQAWAASDAAPTAADMAPLDEGLRLFPHSRLETIVEEIRKRLKAAQ
jgi:hypothetical protein